MNIRGDRECKSCGTRWSYYDTGSVECPECGSLRSVGVDDRTEHTDAPVELDLTPLRNRVDETTTEELAAEVATTCREYTRKRGFIDAGQLQPLDETYVAAVELGAVAAALARRARPSDEAELYFLDLLGGADRGERPGHEAVPEAFRTAFGLAMADAVDSYQRDVRSYLDDHFDDHARRLSGRLRDHRKRIEALDGDVDPADANRLMHAARDLGRYVAGDENAAVTAENWLSGLERDRT
ncbi:DUF7117 family protein [Haloarcula laminariae]|uniref:DUF7117 family protein n=1 Tax=Haloarcula laminariae TaxID=2961577 RepID=UPI0021CA863F|nr:TFIIB-type zinc ribbon-containing protein [Halomicroarcula laminariae]